MSNVIDIKPTLTPKQEQAAQALVCHPDNAVRGNKSAAYRQAYNTENMSNEATWVEANRLFAVPKVALRVQELRQEWYADNPVTMETLLAEYEEGQELARSASQAGAHVAATTAKAKLLGLLVEKQQVDQTVRHAEDVKPAQYQDALAKAKQA